jgi:hypothetical protein
MENDLVPLQSNFFPANFSYVFCKRKIWQEKNYLAKEWIYFAKMENHR